MNIFDSLVSNTICHFSSNFTNTCFASAESNTKHKYNEIELAKMFYRIEYILNKKSRSAKYFAFGFLEEIKRSNIVIPKTVEPIRQMKYEKQVFSEVLNKMVLAIQCLYEKQFKCLLKHTALERLIKNKQQPIFQFVQRLNSEIRQIQFKNKIHGLNKLKQLSFLYQKIDLFASFITRIVSNKNQQKIKIFFDEIHQFATISQKVIKTQNKNSVKQTNQHQKTKQTKRQTKEQSNYQTAKTVNMQLYCSHHLKSKEQDQYITVINVINNQSIQKTYEQDFNSSILSSQPVISHEIEVTSSINSIHQMSEIDSINQTNQNFHSYSVEATPSKTIKQVKEKRRIYLNRHHSRLDSEISNNAIDLKVIAPLQIFQVKSKFIATNLKDNFLQYQQSDFVNGNNSNKIRQLHPDVLSKDLLGDLSDNLDVFPWSPLKDITKSARLSSSSLIPFEVSLSKKKQSMGSILSRSQKFSPNIIYDKPIYESKQLKRINKTSSFKDDETTTKKIKSNSFVGKNLKKNQPSSTQLSKYPQNSTKLLSFLRNQSKQEVMNFNHYNNTSKTLFLKNSNEQNRSRLRNSTNIWGVDRRGKQILTVDDQVTCSNPRVLRKFSPITIIRQKLLNGLK